MQITLTSQLQTLAIMRVDNGWLVRTEHGYASGGMESPLRVAETPHALVAIVQEWAVGQVEKALS